MMHSIYGCHCCVSLSRDCHSKVLTYRRDSMTWSLFYLRVDLQWLSLVRICRHPKVVSSCCLYLWPACCCSSSMIPMWQYHYHFQCQTIVVFHQSPRSIGTQSTRGTQPICSLGSNPISSNSSHLPNLEHQVFSQGIEVCISVISVEVEFSHEQWWKLETNC